VGVVGVQVVVSHLVLVSNVANVVCMMCCEFDRLRLRHGGFSAEQARVWVMLLQCT
jgi:hypothetical protein